MYINVNELANLVAFMKYKTLSQAAKHLLISQPALSKSLHKLEGDLGIQLFKQYPNKLILTDTGLFTAKKAKQLLKDNLAFQEQVQQYENQHHTIRVVTNSPGLKAILEEAVFPQKLKCGKITPITIYQANNKLLNGEVELILSNYKINNSQILSTKLGTEKLFINYPEKIAPKKLVKITPENLPGIIVLNNMGLWEQVFKQYAPKTKLIKQNNSVTLNQIHELSNIPFISSNIYSAITKMDYVTVPVLDQHFQQPIYANYRRNSSHELRPIIKIVTESLNN